MLSWLVFGLKCALGYRLLNVAYYAWKPLYLYVLLPRLDWRPDLSPYFDEWALVTGCTDGIGKAYLRELARRGFRKLALVSRSEAKLDALAEQLSEEFGVETATLAFDFDCHDYFELRDFVAELGPVGLLVNNVGMSSASGRRRFGERWEGEAGRILRVNLLSAVECLDIVLPQMGKRAKGLVVNVGSVSGFRYLPFFSTYPASKAALSLLSESLHDEYKGTGVHIQALIPGLVKTKLSEEFLPGLTARLARLLSATPEEFAKDAVAILGAHHFSTGCLRHDLLSLPVVFLPFWLTKPLMPLIGRLSDTNGGE